MASNLWALTSTLRFGIKMIGKIFEVNGGELRIEAAQRSPIRWRWRQDWRTRPVDGLRFPRLSNRKNKQQDDEYQQQG